MKKDKLNRKIFHLLRVLTKEDLRQIKKMLRSPFFTSNQNLLRLFNFLISYYPDFDLGDRFSEEKIFKKIAPGKVFTSQKLRNLFLDFSMMIEEYLLIKQSRDSKIERSLSLLKLFTIKGANELYSLTENRILKILHESPIDDSSMYMNSYRLNKIQLNRLVSADSSIKRFLKIEESLSHLDNYFRIEEIIGKVDQLNLSKNIDDVNQKLPVRTEPIVFQIYSLIYKLTECQEESVFFELRDLLFEKGEVLQKSIKLEVLQYLINYSIRQLGRKQSYYKELFKLYEWALEHETLASEGWIIGSTYMNIVIIAGRTKEFKWLEKFREKYTSMLPKTDLNGVLNYSDVSILFDKAEYIEAYQAISPFKFKNPAKEALFRGLELKVLYEVFVRDHDYYDQLIDKINSFESWMYRQDLYLKHHIKGNQNFIALIKKLVNEELKGIIDKVEKNKIYKKIMNLDSLSNKYWLAEKVEKLGEQH